MMRLISGGVTPCKQSVEIHVDLRLDSLRVNGVTAGDGKGSTGGVVDCRVGCFGAVTVGFLLDAMAMWWRAQSQYSAVWIRGRG
jgi:hypothetical protein